jgi:hypothetical protein
MTTMNAAAELTSQGWAVLPGAVDAALVNELRSDMERAYAACRDIQVKNGIGEGTDGTVHHLPVLGGSFLQFLERDFAGDMLRDFFGGPYILNSFGGVLNLPSNVSYVGRVHRDLRTFSGELPLMAQLLVMLDDFTEENGATYFLDGSHRRAGKPPDDEFFNNARRAVGTAGSIVMFNSNLWHAAGVNRSTGPRRALTLVFSTPFMKQQLDYPRALGYDRRDSYSPLMQQILGYNARVPASLDEWYQPPEKRLYQRNQG